MTILFIPALLILMYLFLLRPQQQRVRRQRELVASLDVGDEIVTAGGLIGTIVALDGDRAEIEIADGVIVEFLRAAISRKLEEQVPRPWYGAGSHAGSHVGSEVDPEAEEDDEAPAESPSVGEHDTPPDDSR